jgi:hypothetical protein
MGTNIKEIAARAELTEQNIKDTIEHQRDLGEQLRVWEADDLFTFSGWENEFMQSVESRLKLGHSLSDKQASVLEELHETALSVSLVMQQD